MDLNNTIEALKFALFVFIYIYIPGSLLTTRLLRIDDSLRLITLSTAIGTIICGLSYILFKFLEIDRFWYLYAITSLIIYSIYFLNKKIIVFNYPKITIKWLFLSSIIGITIILYAHSNQILSKYFLDGTIMSPDQNFHLGLISQMKKEWPVTDPMLAGLHFKYHYFFHIIIATSDNFLNISSSLIYTDIYYIFLLFGIVICFIYLTKKYNNNISVTSSILLSILLLFFSGPVSLLPFSEINLQNILLNGRFIPIPNYWILSSRDIFLGSSPSLVIGFLFFFPLLNETICYINYAKGSSLILIVILIIGCMIIKGSFIPNYILGVALYFIYLNIFNHDREIKINTRNIFIITSILFMIIYYIYFNGGIVSHQFIGIKYFNILEDNKIFEIYSPSINSFLLNIFGSNLTYKILGNIFLIFTSFAPLIIGNIYLFFLAFSRKDKDILFLIFTAIAGIIISNFTSFHDGNELHFYLSIFPLVALLGSIGILNLLKKPKFFINYIYILITLISILNGFYYLLSFNTKYFDANISRQNNHYKNNSFLYEGQIWLKNNTENFSILAINRFAHENIEKNKKCDYSSNSERGVFLECSYYYRFKDKDEVEKRMSILNRVFYEADVYYLQLLKNKYKVTHLVVEKNDQYVVRLPASHLIRIYDNPEISIFKINLIK